MTGKLQSHCDELEVLWQKFNAKENVALTERDHDEIKNLVLEGKPAVATFFVVERVGVQVGWHPRNRETSIEGNDGVIFVACNADAC